MNILNVTGNYFLKQNDTATEMRLAVKEFDGTPVDLSLASRVEVVIGTLEGRLLVKTPKILSTVGELEFGLDEGDLLPSGDNLLEIHIHTVEGEKRVAPSKGHYKLKVQQAIDDLDVLVTTYTLDYFLAEVNRITFGLPELVVRAEDLADQMDAIIADSATLVADSTLALAQSLAAKTAAESALEASTEILDAAGTNAERAELAAIAAENITALAIPATTAANLAKDAAILATTQANDARDDANVAATRAEGIATNLQGYDAAISDFSLATRYIKNQTVRFNGSTYKAKIETQGNPLPVAPATSNTWFDLIAQRGVDGEGAVASVNGVMPDTDGNVTIVIPEPADPSWTAITDKPITFPPNMHTHAYADVTNKPTTFTPSAHMHYIDDVTGLRDALNNAGTGTGGGIALIGSPERKIQHFTATANQTVFTLDSPYPVGKNLVEVIVGGVPQFAPANFTETSSTTVTLGAGVPVGTIVTVSYYTGFSSSGDIANASTSERGLVKLETSFTSESEITAATPKAVKQVRDEASQAIVTHAQNADVHVTAGIKNNWNYAFDNVYNGGRLGEKCKTITDWNQADRNGWYMALGAANAPYTAWFMGEVIAHHERYFIQRITGFTELTLPRFERICADGTFGPWINMTYKRDLPEPIPLQFYAGWENSDLSNPVRFYIDIFGIVHVYGRARVNATSAQPAMATLPVGYRPIVIRSSIALSGASSSVGIEIHPNGNVLCYMDKVVGNTAYIDISFPTTII